MFSSNFLLNSVCLKLHDPGMLVIPANQYCYAAIKEPLATYNMQDFGVSDENFTFEKKVVSTTGYCELGMATSSMKLKC